MSRVWERVCEDRVYVFTEMRPDFVTVSGYYKDDEYPTEGFNVAVFSSKVRYCYGWFKPPPLSELSYDELDIQFSFSGDIGAFSPLQILTIMEEFKAFNQRQLEWANVRMEEDMKSRWDALSE